MVTPGHHWSQHKHRGSVMFVVNPTNFPAQDTQMQCVVCGCSVTHEQAEAFLYFLRKAHCVLLTMGVTIYVS